ncbi:hypothetical protein HanXRQr2_Chr13g0608201 [Helianthus annuus]|uniref:Uncharacterized protein n=1 Tax=Helianthus annuus TaxID=4232 RepID=A0A9K3EJW7_HELAN|nr:hypothetical protein HanXRQr2_Chr13g0608201 [Helianthus annuus]
MFDKWSDGKLLRSVFIFLFKDSRRRRKMTEEGGVGRGAHRRALCTLLLLRK